MIPYYYRYCYYIDNRQLWTLYTIRILSCQVILPHALLQVSPTFTDLHHRGHNFEEWRKSHMYNVYSSTFASLPDCVPSDIFRDSNRNHFVCAIQTQLWDQDFYMRAALPPSCVSFIKLNLIGLMNCVYFVSQMMVIVYRARLRRRRDVSICPKLRLTRSMVLFHLHCRIFRICYA